MLPQSLLYLRYTLICTVNNQVCRVGDVMNSRALVAFYKEKKRGSRLFIAF